MGPHELISATTNTLDPVTGADFPGVWAISGTPSGAGGSPWTGRGAWVINTTKGHLQSAAQTFAYRDDLGPVDLESMFGLITDFNTDTFLYPGAGHVRTLMQVFTQLTLSASPHSIMRIAAYSTTTPDFPSNDRDDGTPRWFNYVNRRLDALEAYPQSDPTDPEAYPKPPPETIRSAWRVAHMLFDRGTATPTVVPAEEGGVEFAWHKNGWDLVISVLPEETFVWARNPLTGENWSYPLLERFERVRTILANLSS